MNPNDPNAPYFPIDAAWIYNYNILFNIPGFFTSNNGINPMLVGLLPYLVPQPNVTNPFVPTVFGDASSSGTPASTVPPSNPFFMIPSIPNMPIPTSIPNNTSSFSNIGPFKSAAPPSFPLTLPPYHRNMSRRDLPQSSVSVPNQNPGSAAVSVPTISTLPSVNKIIPVSFHPNPITQPKNDAPLVPPKAPVTPPVSTITHKTVPACDVTPKVTSSVLTAPAFTPPPILPTAKVTPHMPTISYHNVQSSNVTPTVTPSFVISPAPTPSSPPTPSRPTVIPPVPSPPSPSSPIPLTKKGRKRRNAFVVNKTYTAEQSRILFEAYEPGKRPCSEKQEELALRSGLEKKQISKWYHNREQSLKKAKENGNEDEEKKRVDYTRKTLQDPNLASDPSYEYNVVVNKNKPITDEAKLVLFEVYQKNNNPDRKTREEMAKKLGLTYYQVYKWFHRARGKTAESEERKNNMYQQLKEKQQKKNHR